MKKLLIGFAILASLSSFAKDSQEISPMVHSYLSAVYTLQNCDVNKAVADMDTCDVEIGHMMDSNISLQFIINGVEKRGLDLPDEIDGYASRWFYVKAYREYEKEIAQSNN